MPIRLGGREYKIEGDKGCGLFPSCLNCPLPRCVFDSGQKRFFQKTYVRYLAIARQHEANHITHRRLAKRHGVTVRTVERALKWYKDVKLHTEEINHAR